MKITKSQLKQIIKEEIAGAGQGRLHDEPSTRRGTPSWYSEEGGVADRLHEMAGEIRSELDVIKQRLDALESKV